MRGMRAVVGVGLAVVLLAGCGDDDDTGSATTATSATSSSVPEASSTTEASASTTAAAPTFPAANDDLTHGGTTWAVVLAGDLDPEAPILQAAQAAAEAAGYATGPTDCDVGAPAVLGMTEEGSISTISVYFRSEADAQAALDAFHATGWEGGAAGQVETFCLD